MRSAELAALGLREVTEAIRAGTVSPVDLVDACLARIRALDGELRAWAHALSSPSSARILARHASTRSTGLTVPARIASVTSRRPSAASSADRIENLRHDLEAPERRHQIGAPLPRPHGTDELLRHLDPDPERAVSRLAEPPANRVGNRDARHLVVKELRVPRAVQREDPPHHPD